MYLTMFLTVHVQDRIDTTALHVPDVFHVHDVGGSAHVLYGGICRQEERLLQQPAEHSDRVADAGCICGTRCCNGLRRLRWRVSVRLR